jgi:two-component system, NarL family, nitrate/nitrite response regulator NarL
MASTSVFLIDASRLFREGLRRIFSNTSLVVVHESGSVEDALPSLESLQPILVLVDLPEGDELVRGHISRIHTAAPSARIVILTEAIRVDCFTDALALGVDGYLLKNISADALYQSLALVLLGEKVFPSDLVHLLTNGRIKSRSDVGKTCHMNGLSDREIQILRYLLDGAENKRIAQHLDISDGAVKAHIKAILKKVHAQNRTQAAIWALGHGIERDMSEDAPAPENEPDEQGHRR